MNLDDFLIGVATGMMIVFFFVVLNWRYLRSKLQKVSNGRKQEPIEYMVEIVITIVEEGKEGIYPVGDRFTLPEWLTWQRMIALSKKVIDRGYVWNYGLTGLSVGNPLSRNEYDSLCPTFVEHDIIKQKLPTSSRTLYEVTSTGQAFFRRWANLPFYQDHELIAHLKDRAQTHTNTITGSNRTQ